MTDGERALWRIFAAVCIVMLGVVTVKQLADGIPFMTLAGSIALSLQLGKWSAPHFKRLDTDRYPTIRDLERVSPSLSLQSCWAYWGSSRSV